jgi:hypothetical protein
MRGVFFGVEAILYSFTLPQRFWQVTSAIAQSTEIPTVIDRICYRVVLLSIVRAIAPSTYHLFRHPKSLFIEITPVAICQGDK